MEKLEWFTRWHGGSLFVCLVLLSIFGGGGRGPWIVVISSLAGIPIAIWLTRADKKRKAALQSRKVVVESE